MARSDGLRVTVIGAGAAGLSAAAALNEAGSRVVCLEARERVGGRLLSRPGVGRAGALDLGATWFWDGENRVGDLVERFRIATFDQHASGGALYQDLAGTHRLPGNPMDVPAYRYATGADHLAVRLAARLPEGALHLGSPVSAIRHMPGGMEVTTPGETHFAEHVVLAVPPALAVERIDFQGALPAELFRLAAATPVWMGAVAKTVAVYPEAFWRTAGLAGSAFSRVGPLQEVHDMSGPAGAPAALFGFAPGAAAARSGFRQAVVDQLVSLFGPAAARPERLHVQDWSRDRWTSPPGVQRLTDYALFGHTGYQRPAMGGRLHWASTETAHEYAGHLEGALAAGQRAAETVLAAGPAPVPTR